MRAFVVDAFTDSAFRGNPAGVVLDDCSRDDAWRQSLAAELRHSETAFVAARADGDYDLRWFTPTSEVDLCGHGTLAAAHILASDGVTGPMVFHTRSGLLHADVAADGVTLDFPVATSTRTPAAWPPSLPRSAPRSATSTARATVTCSLWSPRNMWSRPSVRTSTP